MVLLKPFKGLSMAGFEPLSFGTDSGSLYNPNNVILDHSDMIKCNRISGLNNDCYNNSHGG